MEGCRFCKNFETGDDWYPFIEGVVDLGVAGDLQISVALMPKDKDILPQIALMSSMDNGDQGCEVYEEIYYCPICGRDLTKEN